MDGLGREPVVSPAPRQNPQSMSLRLYRLLGPIVREHLAWRRETAGSRVPCDVVFTRSNYGRFFTDPIELRGAGAHDTLRRVAAFVVPADRVTGDTLTSAPIGDYGEEWAGCIAWAGHWLLRDWHTFWSSHGPRLSGGAGDDALAALSAATVQGNVWMVPGGQAQDQTLYVIRRIVDDAIVSVGQALSQLTVHRVPDYPDPHRLAADAVAARLLDRFALLLPLNVLGPATVSGLVLPSPVLERDTAGGVRFSESCSEFLQAQHALHRQEVQARPYALRAQEGRAAAGEGCPFGSRHGLVSSVVQETALAFNDALAQVARHRPGARFAP